MSPSIEELNASEWERQIKSAIQNREELNAEANRQAQRWQSLINSLTKMHERILQLENDVEELKAKVNQR